MDHSHPTLAEIYGYGILANAICCICSLGGAVILPCARRFTRAYHIFLSIFLGLAVGTLFTGAVVHLIPEAIGIHGHSRETNLTDGHHTDGHKEYDVKPYVWYLLIVLMGTYIFYLLEMIMTLMKRKTGQTQEISESPETFEISVCEKQNGDFHKMNEVHGSTENKPIKTDKDKGTGITPLVIMVIIGDAIHNTADGLALGAAFTSSIAEGISLTIAIFCHELPHELGDFAILLNSGMGFCKAVMANLLSSLTAFIGFIIGVQVSADETSRQWIFAITAGMFLYISLVDMLPELVRLGSKNVKTFVYHNIGIILGALILVVIGVFEEHIDVH